MASPCARAGRFWIVVGTVLAIHAWGSMLFAEDPLNIVKATTDRALQVLNDPRLKGPEKKTERIERLKEIINPMFDFEETAKRSLGAHWRRRTPAEQQEFVRLFRAFLERVYSDRIDEYAGEKFTYNREKIEGDYAEIDATVVNAKGEETSVIFRLRNAGGKWLVYDAVVENISLVNNYRSQFDRVIRTSSYEELVKKIREKIQS